MTARNRRLAVLALSEASPELLDRFCADGAMPRLARLRANAAVGRTRYSAPFLLTPQMWATILTGRSAGSHGLYDYWQRGSDGIVRESRGHDIKGPRFWDELDRQGIPSGIVNVPMTYPPPQTKGFAISGQDAPGEHRSIMHPPNIHGELATRFGRYHHKDIFPGPHRKEEYGDVLAAETRWQAGLFERLLERTDWRFSLLYSSGTAFAQHYFWSDLDGPSEDDIVRRTFTATDELIGRVSDALAPGDTLMVISECGAGALSSGIRLNRWLEEQGFLKRRQVKSSPLTRLLAQARTAAPRYLPRELFYYANRSRVKTWVQQRIAADAIAWPATLAYHRGKGEGNIYINLEGREPEGVVPREDYDALRASIRARLLDLIDPATGRRAVAGVHRREDLYKGDIDAAPDLIVEWENFSYMPAESLDAGAKVFGPRIREYMSWPTTGSHRREGIFLAVGDGIAHRTLERRVDLLDLAPTFLDFFDAQPSAIMEGRSILPQLRG